MNGFLKDAVDLVVELAGLMVDVSKVLDFFLEKFLFYVFFRNRGLVRVVSD